MKKDRNNILRMIIIIAVLLCAPASATKVLEGNDGSINKATRSVSPRSSSSNFSSINLNNDVKWLSLSDVDDRYIEEFYDIILINSSVWDLFNNGKKRPDSFHSIHRRLMEQMYDQMNARGSTVERGIYSENSSTAGGGFNYNSVYSNVKEYCKDVVLGYEGFDAIGVHEGEPTDPVSSFIIKLSNKIWATEEGLYFPEFKAFVIRRQSEEFQEKRRSGPSIFRFQGNLAPFGVLILFILMLCSQLMKHS